VQARIKARQNAEAARETERRGRQNERAYKQGVRNNLREHLANKRRANNVAAATARATAKNAVNSRLAEISRIQKMNNNAINAAVRALNTRNNKRRTLTKPEIAKLIRAMTNNQGNPLHNSIKQTYINRYFKFLRGGKASLREKIAAPFRGGSSRASAARQGFRGLGSRVSSAFGRVGNRFRVSTTRSNKAIMRAENNKAERNASSQ
jgi:hypothetical protein